MEPLGIFELAHRLVLCFAKPLTLFFIFMLTMRCM
jgi:hypothetical protein